MNISWHYIFTPDNILSGGDYIVTLYFHSWQYLVRGWLYRDIIFSLPTIFGGGDHIVTLYLHPWQYLVRGWLYRDIIFSLPTIFGGGDYIVTLYLHPWQYLVRGWLYRDTIFSPLTVFGQGVIISWHYIFTPDNIWWGGEYIVTLYFHSWQYLVRGWLYRDIIFSLLTIFGEGVIISWHYIFTPEDIWWGGDYIVTLQYHFWHYPRIWHWRWLYWIFSLSKFDSAVIPGFYHSYPYIHPMELEGLKWLYSSMIPSLLLKLSVLVDMLMDCVNSLWWTNKRPVGLLSFAPFGPFWVRGEDSGQCLGSNWCFWRCGKNDEAIHRGKWLQLLTHLPLEKSHHFGDNILWCILVNEKYHILIKSYSELEESLDFLIVSCFNVSIFLIKEFATLVRPCFE